MSSFAARNGVNPSDPPAEDSTPALERDRTTRELIRLNRGRSGWNTQEWEPPQGQARALEVRERPGSEAPGIRLPPAVAGTLHAEQPVAGRARERSPSHYELARTMEYSRALMQDEALRAAVRSSAANATLAPPAAAEELSVVSMPLPRIKRNIAAPLFGIMAVTAGLVMLGYLVVRELPRDISRSVQAFTERAPVR